MTTGDRREAGRGSGSGAHRRRPGGPGDGGPPDIPKHVLLRDLMILQLKLWLDGIKDIILSPLSIGATVLDVLAGPRSDGHRLYRVLRWGERFDLWLNLYGATDLAESSGEGLYGGSRAGDETLIGRLERLARGYDEPEDPDDVG